MTVAAILKRKGHKVITISPNETTQDLARLLAENSIGAAVVLASDGLMLGVASERDIVLALTQIGPQALGMPISAIMNRNLAYCSAHDSVETVMQLMTARRARHLPVLDHGELVGIVSIGDVVKERIALTEFEAESLRLYIIGNV